MNYLDEETSNIVRKNVRLYLADKKIYVKDVAKNLGIRGHALSQILNRKRHRCMELSLVEKIAEAIDVKISHLLVEMPLYLEPEMKEFLEDENNIDFLMDYIKKIKK